NIEWNNSLSFGCIVDRNSDIIFGKLAEEQKKNLREIINLAYDQYEISPIISELIKENDEEFEDICVMHTQSDISGATLTMKTRLKTQRRHICYGHVHFYDKEETSCFYYGLANKPPETGPSDRDVIFIKLKIIWAKKVSEASQHWMDNSGEIRIGHNPNFHVKSPLIAGEVEICLMEASHVLPTVDQAYERCSCGTGLLFTDWISKNI
ncbi:1760_t:CDS:2, partial [Dentiscutata erythropus]